MSDTNIVKRSSSTTSAISYYNDIKLAQQLNGIFNPSTSQIETLDDTLSSVEYYQYPAWTKANTTYFGAAHASIYVNGYIYLSTRQMPARVAKINANDLSDVTYLTFPGTNSTSLYSIADRIIYSEYTKKLYIAFGDPDYNRNIKIAEIDPDTLAYSIVIETSGYPGYPSGVAKGNKLYIMTGYTTKRVIEFSLDTYTLLRSCTLTMTATPHAINIDEDYIYVTGIYTGASIHKISLDTFTIVATRTLPTVHMTDEFAIVGDYLWIGSESDLDGTTNKGIYVVNKKDFTADYNKIYVESDHSEWGLFYDNTWVWAVFYGTPGTVLRIDPKTYEVRKFSLSTNIINPNTVCTDGKNLFISNFDVPTVIGRYTVPTIFDEVYYAGTDGDILMKISDTNKRVEFIDTIIPITHAALIALKNASKLSPGTKYKITDFKTKYRQPVSNVIKEASSYETLILTATSINTFDKRVQSLEYPNDIIEYDITNILCEDSSTARKGFITYRKDNTLNIEYKKYDGRNIQFRRWKIKCADYNVENTYNIGFFATYNNKIYVSIQDNHSEIPTDDTYWKVFLDYTTTPFIYYDNQMFTDGYGNNLSAFMFYNFSDLYIDNSIEGTDYKDFYTISSATGTLITSSVRDITIDSAFTNNNVIISSGTISSIGLSYNNYNNTIISDSSIRNFYMKGGIGENMIIANGTYDNIQSGINNVVIDSYIFNYNLIVGNLQDVKLGVILSSHFSAIAGTKWENYVQTYRGFFGEIRNCNITGWGFVDVYTENLTNFNMTGYSIASSYTLTDIENINLNNSKNNPYPNLSLISVYPNTVKDVYYDNTLSKYRLRYYDNNVVNIIDAN